MKITLKTALLAAALTMPTTFASAQTPPAAPSAQAPDPHHPAGQDSGATAPAPGIAPSSGTPPATSTAPSTTPANPQAQMGAMMGDMRQMMGMMQQMMRMMGGGSIQGGAPGGMMGGGMMGGGTGQAGTPGAGQGGMMGSGMPMMGTMSGQQGPGGPGMGPMAGGPGGPGMFRHTEGILAFYKAELRITDAQTAPWNAFADAVRTHVKKLQEAMQRATSQRAAATAPEQLDQRVAMLTSYLDAAKAVSAAAKTLYAVLAPEQRKLADEFMTDHMRGMRRMTP